MTADISAILSHKYEVDRCLKEYLIRKRGELSRVNRWGEDVINRLLPFVIAGKTIRGSLAVYAYRLFRKKNTDTLLYTASALELFQAGFLIHDDIMDRDSLRRGKPSIHEQYRKLHEDGKPAAAYHFGISMGINAADLCFFLGYELLWQVYRTHDLRGIIGKEMQAVVIAQMQDVASNKAVNELSKEAVMSLYRYKTARYTFSVPLTVGATLARAPEAVVSQLDRLGESMGLLFQIRDDELSVSGQPALTGKPIGSDERNAKHTLSSLLSSEEMNELKSSLLEHGEGEIKKLPIDASRQKELAALMKYCITREK